MKFCKYCGSRMTKTADTQTGQITYKCICANVEIGAPEDTLMAEEVFLESSSLAIYHDLIENSPYDTAGSKTMKKCPDCGINFLTLIRISDQEIVMYTCTCGFKSTHDNYVKLTQKT